MYPPRIAIFADGENLVIRFQEMLAAGRKVRPEVVHIHNCYVWSPRIVWNHDHAEHQLVSRVYYYTSVTGDEPRATEVRDELSKIEYICHPDATNMSVIHRAQLVPVVFRKLRQSQKTRNVDIQIVIDVMRCAYSDQFEQLYILSGDGDYLPLVKEVSHLGKQVRLGAFSSGLNSKLRSNVDRFTSLDSAYFES